MFKEYQGKAIVRKAFEITSPNQFVAQYEAKSDSYRHALKTESDIVEFVAHEEVNVGDFVVYLNENDVYHCNRKVFLERNEYPAKSEYSAKAPMSAVQIEEMMKALDCDGDYISSAHIINRIETIDFQTVHLAGQKLMYCGIRMKGGFVVVGDPSVCIDPKNWREEIGKKISFENTFNQIFKLEAYLQVESK